MRALAVAVALLGLVAIPGVAEAARDWWEGVGIGQAQESGHLSCSAVYQVGLTREGQYSWYVHVEMYPVPSRQEIGGCLPRGYVFPNVSGGPNNGWNSFVTTPCAIAQLEVGRIGAVPAGQTELEFFFSDTCVGHTDRGSATVALMSPDT